MTFLQRLLNTLAAASFLLPVSAIAQTDSQAQLDALLQEFETLQADVLQLIVESDGGVLEESEIRMALKRPSGFYWETIEPFPELVVTDGSKLWNYQPDLEQLVIEDWNSEDSELAAQLLSGDTEQLKTEYAVQLLDSDDESFQQFRLTPLALESIYNSITLSFSNAAIQSIHIANKNGQQTVWEFNSVQQNVDIEDELFSFSPPADIEIIDNSTGA